MTSTSWMHEAGHSKLVHWDNPQDGMGKEMGGGSGCGTHVLPWMICVDVWQETTIVL